ncbi:hypothetical protein D1007_55915 [Hordeum vulgare]|nr:hypothetical protein D1007_55915 [Hordeum vulgare]
MHVEMAAANPAADEVAAADPAPPTGGSAAAVGNAEDEVPEEEEHAEDAPVFNPLAIAPYQRPLIQQTNLVVGVARVFIGPPLPPVISWARSFESLMGAACTMHVPRHLQMPLVLLIMIPKRSWSSDFDAEAAGPSSASVDNTPAPSPEFSWIIE